MVGLPWSWYISGKPCHDLALIMTSVSWKRKTPPRLVMPWFFQGYLQWLSQACQRNFWSLQGFRITSLSFVYFFCSFRDYIVTLLTQDGTQISEKCPDRPISVFKIQTCDNENDKECDHATSPFCCKNWLFYVIRSTGLKAKSLLTSFSPVC